MILRNNSLKQTIFQSIMVLLLSGCTTPSIIATKSIQQGDVFNNENKYNDAISHYEEYLNVSPQLGVYRNAAMEAEVCRKLAHAYSTQGKYSRAKKYLEQALISDSTLGSNQMVVAEDFQLLGLVNAYAGDIHQALLDLNKSLRITDRMDKSIRNDKRSSIAGTHLAISQVHLILGNYHEAENHAKNALETYSKLPQGAAGVIETELILGVVFRDKGELAEAEKRLIKSQSLALKQQLNTGRQLQAISEIHMLKGKIEESIRYKLLALDEARKSNITPQVIIALMRLGDAYNQLGDEKKARDYYQRALSLQGEMDGSNTGFNPGLNPDKGNPIEMYDYYVKFNSALGKGLVLLRMGATLAENEPDSAMLLLEEARENLTKGENKEAVAKTNLELAKIFIKLNRYSEGSKLLKEATALTIQPDLKWQISFQSGIISEKRNRYDSARYYYENSIDIIDGIRVSLSVDEFKTLFASSKIDVYDRMILLLLRNKDGWKDLSSKEAIIRAFNYNEQGKSRTFLDKLGNKRIEPRQTSDTIDLANEQLLRLKIQQLVKEINNTGNNYEAQKRYSDDLNIAQKDYEELIQKIKLNNPAYSTVINVTLPDLAQVQTALNTNTALIEYWVSQETLVIFTIDRTQIKSQLIEVSRRDLQRHIARARNGIAHQEEIMAAESLKKLYQMVVEPVYHQLSSFNSIVIIPHRSLHFLPFQALPIPGGKYMIERHAISYAPSASILYYCLQKKVETGDHFLGMALGNNEVGTNKPLPGTDIEVIQLMKLYPGAINRSNSEFLETAFKKESSDFNYIHIATHGVFNKLQPLHSYLLMNESPTDDGQLTVDEIFGLRIKSQFVTLSACETALGDLDEGDELVGLSRAFIYAGTRGVIVSLWKVEDATTAWLMTRFHQYSRSGLDAAEALTNAQRDLLAMNFSQIAFRGKNIQMDKSIEEAVLGKSATQLRNPYYWAPFILIGNGFVR